MPPNTVPSRVPARVPSHRAARRHRPLRLLAGAAGVALAVSVVALGALTVRSVTATEAAHAAYADDAPAPRAPVLGTPAPSASHDPAEAAPVLDVLDALPPATDGPVLSAPQDSSAHDGLGPSRAGSRLVPVTAPVADRATARLLDRRVAARRRALATLERQAAAWSRVLADRSATLTELGYSGDPSAVSVVLPLASYRLSASFGAAGDLWARDHTGQDFGAASGTPLHAVAEAEVLSVGDAGAYGLRTVFGLPDGTQIWYCHQLTALVAPGETVEVAETVGLVGSTGNSTGPHLHLEVRNPAGVPVDPSDWLAAHGVTP
ncbi:peptidoglycan DD-metalloendopeptidase family protein [Nocardioides campestrisoli]|uniref:peptidoglycan DD-metalloendopeptidase family protein n=1 Tax=Nocardioides campestrisoli TaxID=2736757 RepID=UPI00163D7F9F|nr:peptidoglycan DD-metalloendopeptidase family protein [Nocardioides campestrisoli]